MSTDKKVSLGGLVLGLLIIFFAARSLPFGSLGRPGSGFFPLLIGVLLGVLCLILLLKRWKTPMITRAKGEAALTGKKRVAMAFTALLIYDLLLEKMGFLFCTFFLMFFMLKTVGGRKWFYALWVSVLTAAMSFIIFQELLHSPLPPGILGFLNL